MKKNIILFFIIVICWFSPDIIFILVSENVYKLQNKDSSVNIVKENMDILQNMIETYSFDHNGFYPDTLLDLYKASILEPSYTQKLTNPFTGEKQNINNYNVAINACHYKDNNNFKYVTIYMPLQNKDNKIISYKIYGTDKEGKLLRAKGNKTFKLIKLDLL